MKRLLKRHLAAILSPLTKRLGLVSQTEVVDKNNLLRNLFQTVIDLGFQPKHIVDVGANHGTWTREALQYFPHAYYTLLEPQAALAASIADLTSGNNKIQFHAVGAGEKAGTFSFTLVDRDDSRSFAIGKEAAIAMGYSQVQLPVVTLNEFLPGLGLPSPDLIKIDAEGLDLAVLRGGNSFFGIAEVFMVEAGVVSKGGENSVRNVINYMDENGYRLFDITDINRPLAKKVLWLVELVFVKKDGIIDSQRFV
jgi:FkbM family methyltransferase